MPLPYYVSPEQMMKDKAEYARKGISRGRSIVTLEIRDGILLVAENPSTLLHKISEIYDRIAFAGLGNIFTQDIKPFEVEVLVAEVAEGNGSRNEIYHILYDGTIEDERNYAAMGGQADEIRRFLKDHFREGLPLDEALQLGVRALTVTQNKTLNERDLEVAVLDRTKERRKFRRIPPEALSQLLGTQR